MASLVVAGDVSGSVTLSAPSAAGSTVITLPTTSGTMVVTGGAQTVQFAAGSAASPSITFTGDTNTGIFSPAADTIGFSEGGVESMRIDSSGNVGIGTSSPTQRLTVAGSTSLGTASSSGNTSIFQAPGSLYLTLNTNGTLGGSRRNWAISPEYDAAGALSFTVGASEGAAPTATRMLITSAGNVGIGTTSPWSSISLNTPAAATDGYLGIKDPTYGGDIRFGKGSGINNDAIAGVWSNNNFLFYTNSTERMRIDSVGRLLIGKTVSTATIPGILLSSASGQYMSNVNNDWNMELFGSGGFRIRFNGSDNGTSTVGSITSGTSSTSYTTTSDYRLKENITPMTGALDKVKQLKPCNYTWKSTGEAGQGFIAHELQAVVPDAVTGEKDAVNEDGSINPQGVDTSFLVATLTAAIQELNAKVEAQAAEIAALKGAN